MLQPATSVGVGLIITWISYAEASVGGGGGGGGGGGFWSSSAGSNVGLAIAVTAMAGIALAATLVYSQLRKEQSLLRSLRRSNASSSSRSSSSNSRSLLPSSSSSSSWIHLRSVLLVVASPSSSASSSSRSPPYSKRGSLKSPWSHRRRKHTLLPKQWRNLFGPDGKLLDGGVKFLKKVRSGGVDPSIRAEVWPFLLGVYDLNSSKEERDSVRRQNRQEYEDLRKECQKLLKLFEKNSNLKDDNGNNSIEDSNDFSQVLNPIVEEGSASSGRSSSSEKEALPSLQTECQTGYEFLQSSNMVAVVGNNDRGKDSVLQCTDTVPAAVAEKPGDHILHPSSTNSGGHLQKNGNQDCLRKEMSVEGNVEKPYHQGFQASASLASLPNCGDHDDLEQHMLVEGHADKHKQQVLRPSETITLGHLQKNGEQDIYGRDTMAEGPAEKPGCKVPEPSGENLRKDADVDHPEKDTFVDGDTEKSGLTSEGVIAGELDSTDSDSSEEPENLQPSLVSDVIGDADLSDLAEEILSTSENGNKTKAHVKEDFATWQRIIRLDALRANAEWVIFSPSQAKVTEERAKQFADSVGLKEYDHLEPCRIFHAARLVVILDTYALYDQEIGYCQGMSDLLSPIISVMEDDDEAFRCFVGFMKKARHNFRLDEVGIRGQLNIVSKIIKCKDSHLYSHLEKLQAEDCFFVYRMVVVLFRRELNFEQTLCLWEVMWADQAAIRAGIAKSAWGRMRLQAPPTNDLLLYAIAACVLQRRKLIIEKYSSMEEIMRECNSMAGHLDVWRLLDDAHDLVVTLHEKIQ